MFLSSSDFINVVKNTPLVSIDLCILRGREILLGKRLNPPAKNFYFVPGGRILKGELKKNALKRILKDELGLRIKIFDNKSVKNIGFYEHLYDDNFLGNNDFSTHYLVIAYLIKYKSLLKINNHSIKQQHSEYKWIDLDNAFKSSYKIHTNTLEYFKNPLFKNN